MTDKTTRELPAIMRPIPATDTSRLRLTDAEREACLMYLGGDSDTMSDWALFAGVESAYPGGWAAFAEGLS